MPARLTRIFQILVQLPPGKSITSQDLADRIHISRRTLFRELESARSLLEPYHIQLVTRPGLRLEGDLAPLKQLLGNEHSQALNREERQDMLLFELLRSQQTEKLIVYASRFQVSEATISHDMEDLRRRIEPYGLRLTKSGAIQGEEEAIRQVMAMLMREGVEYKTVDYLNPDTMLDQVFSGSAILQLLDQKILKDILALFSEKREELGFARYEQNSYIGLVIHLVIALERIRSGEAAAERLPELPDMEDSRQEAARLARLLEEKFQVQFPDTEIDAIALHLRGAKMNTAAGTLTSQQNEVIDLARAFIEGFAPQDAALLSTDAQFIQGLISHLEPTVIRLRSQLPIYNPLLKTLKEQYGDLFGKTRQAAKSLEELLGLPLSEEEIGFLTMHVGACFERSGHQYRRRVRGAVVCASGIGVSALLCARLEKAFASQLDLENLSVVQARNRHDIELFVTTFPAGSLPAPTVEVSCMLGAQDLQKIQEQLAAIQARPAPETVSSISLESQLARLKESIEAVQSLLGQIPIIHSRSRTPRSLIHEAAAHMQGDKERLEADLWRRETLGPVVALQEAFGLYHAASPAADTIQAAVLVPEEGPFYDGLRVILVTVLPETHTKAMQEVLSDLNRALAQEETFRQVLMDGPDEARLEALRGVLTEYIRHVREMAEF